MVEKPPIQALKSGQHIELTISDEHFRLIGQVVVSWSRLEAALEDCIWCFLNLEEDDGRIITRRLDAEAKIQLLRQFAPRRKFDEKGLSDFNDLLNLIGEFKDNRNFICHGVWGTLMPDNIPIALSQKPKADDGVVISEDFPRDRMEALIGLIQYARERIIIVREEFRLSLS
ncbi:MAG: hypothetical protein ACOY15_02570 [Pseudomonadota bacterium]